MKSKITINSDGSITTTGTVTFNKNGKLIIPVSFLENMNITKDSNRQVDIILKNGEITIKPKEVE